MTLYEIWTHWKGIKFGRLKEMCINLLQWFSVSISENDWCKEYKTDTKLEIPTNNKEWLNAMHKIQLIAVE